MSYSQQPQQPGYEDDAPPARPRPRMGPERSSSRRSMYRVSSGAAYASVLPFSAANRTPSPDEPIYVDPNRLSRISTYSNHTSYSSTAQATSRPLPPPPPPPEEPQVSAPSAPPAPPAHSRTRSTSFTAAPTASVLPPVPPLPSAAPIHSRHSSYGPDFDMNRYPDTSYDPHPVDARYDGYPDLPRGQSVQRDSWTSHTGLTGASAPPYGYTPGYSARNSAFEPTRPGSFNHAWPDDGRGDLGMGLIDPTNIEDDGDDGFDVKPRDRSRSPLAPGFPLTKQARDASGSYDHLPDGGSHDPEKSTWLKHETGSNKKLKWRVAGLIIFVIVLGTVLGVIGAVLTNKTSSSNADKDDGTDLTKDSPSITALMNNPNLHKVFPGMDYTPLNAQYPDCLHKMPSQNNITKDIAVLSQLTPAVRLYGTDCNQTEMVLHAIDALGLKDKMKVWMGVWIESNQTTNDRQISQMYDILDSAGADPFAGIIVGNEVLFRKQLSETQLGDLLSSVRTNLTAKNINLPVATSDLGSAWDQGLAAATDVVMSNVHPFFGGVPVDQAASWTWTFWQNNDVALTGTSKKQVISEVGWPSGGGQNCVANDQTIDCASSTDGSVAGITQMNKFMSDFICPSLVNNTDFFWFEAFDEPWKVRFNTASQQWEDKWGLLDVNRNLKAGVKIPDCGDKNLS